MVRPVVSLEDITKRFGQVVANHRVTLRVYPGEVHALLGANGAGKSTLMAILSGLYQPDQGTIRVEERPVRFPSPAHALRHGISMLYQHTTLVQGMTVAENLMLGAPHLPWLLPDRRLLREAVRWADELGFRLDLDAVVEELGAAQRQQVELVRNLLRASKVVILDEPTAMLVPQEAERVGRAVRALASRGVAVVLVTHRLEEALGLADRVTVMRKGRVVSTRPAGECTVAGLVREMVGEIQSQEPARMPLPLAAGPVAELHDVWTSPPRPLRGVNLTVLPGEIVGLIGLATAGHTVVAEVLAGVRPVSRGRVVVDGHDLTHEPVAAFRSRGIRYVPADRLGRGVAGSLSLADNALVTWIERVAPHGWLPKRVTEAFGRRVVAQAQIKPPDISLPAASLSGGNLQKLLVARETLEPPRLLVAEYPLHGLDPEASAWVRARLWALAAAGTGILWVGEDIQELIASAHRIAVVTEGRIVASYDPGQVDPVRVGMDMLGASP